MMMDSFNLASIDLSRTLGVIPLCITATSKTTTTNDPTAGMTPDEITNYVSNVGGGMCGAPEGVRAAIGLGLNLSLIAFGIFTVSYVILGGLNFALEKNVEDLVKQKVAAGDDDLKSFAAAAGFSADGVKVRESTGGSMMSVGGFDEEAFERRNNDGKNREERRISKRLKNK
eukprot:CAMPEP_0174968182 /NCGR_PEP_ID=MMETSP0004_2-20121128/7987_1 /TAXON_ID=420556 /ORGANISM="Ochromonas sp., Strain CCMP1393" /LENGTH=171 /DNA_ID=CAMNT_0016217377 /DNA_START=147 /DNA_END=662 /DNA_ORIENTATION=-